MGPVRLIRAARWPSAAAAGRRRGNGTTRGSLHPCAILRVSGECREGAGCSVKQRESTARRAPTAVSHRPPRQHCTSLARPPQQQRRRLVSEPPRVSRWPMERRGILELPSSRAALLFVQPTIAARVPTADAGSSCVLATRRPLGVKLRLQSTKQACDPPLYLAAACDDCGLELA